MAHQLHTPFKNFTITPSVRTPALLQFYFMRIWHWPEKWPQWASGPQRLPAYCSMWTHFRRSTCLSSLPPMVSVLTVRTRRLNSKGRNMMSFAKLQMRKHDGMPCSSPVSRVGLFFIITPNFTSKANISMIQLRCFYERNLILCTWCATALLVIAGRSFLLYMNKLVLQFIQK